MTDAYFGTTRKAVRVTLTCGGRPKIPTKATGHRCRPTRQVWECMLAGGDPPYVFVRMWVKLYPYPSIDVVSRDEMQIPGIGWRVGPSAVMLTMVARAMVIMMVKVELIRILDGDKWGGLLDRRGRQERRRR